MADNCPHCGAESVTSSFTSDTVVECPDDDCYIYYWYPGRVENDD